ncbi:MAG: FKBP-type peptidyl-prolyl cis-trans isomerase [Weeksellaceae bacterium]|jgi:FKBP-type peptidyl-prolyl cis-trans isomerase FkpA
MKKIIATLTFAALVISCDNFGGSSKKFDKFSNDDEKAAYALGMNIASELQFQAQSMADDSLDYAEVKRGIEDFFKKNEDKRTSYFMGQAIGRGINDFIKNQELEGTDYPNLAIQGLFDVLEKKDPLFPQDSIQAFMGEYMRKSQEAKTSQAREEGENFLAEKRKDEKVKSTPSGLLYEIISEGDGAMPTDDSRVKVNYVGKHMDGEIFDQSKGEPVEFPLRGVIKGWQEGLKLMKAGSKYKFYIPSELAYGEFGTPDGSIKPNEVLVFDVELISVEELPDATTP